MKSTGSWSWNDLQVFDLKIGQQDSSSSYGHQSDLPCLFWIYGERVTAIISWPPTIAITAGVDGGSYL